MKKNGIFHHLSIDYYSATPKYLQLANFILQAIAEEKIVRDEPLPSINELSFELDISRDTAEKAYKYLKQIGALKSVPGKGSFVNNTDIRKQLRVFLLFNKLSYHKKIVYDAFAGLLNEAASIDFYIYNNDLDLFKKLIQHRHNDYTHYVIVPPSTEDEADEVKKILETFPPEQLILLDKLVPGFTGPYSAVYENFERDIYHALEEALELLSKYHTLKIIFPEYSYHPKDILKGFQKFCNQYAFNYKTVHNIANEPVKEGVAYINLMETDLVILIEKILATKMKIGKHVGVISYNETPLKKIILNGLTTISTDFQWMGERAARIILDNQPEKVAIPFYLTRRASL
jgi:DNA-binding transcriptional regulator YhcF (GntR family)